MNNNFKIKNFHGKLTITTMQICNAYPFRKYRGVLNDIEKIKNKFSKEFVKENIMQDGEIRLITPLEYKDIVTVPVYRLTKKGVEAIGRYCITEQEKNIIKKFIAKFNKEEKKRIKHIMDIHRKNALSTFDIKGGELIVKAYNKDFRIEITSPLTKEKARELQNLLEEYIQEE